MHEPTGTTFDLLNRVSDHPVHQPWKLTPGSRGWSKTFETRQQYLNRLDSYYRMARPTGTILDFLAHGPEQSSGAAAPTATSYAGAGIPAKYKRGVLFQGPWETYADGFSEHLRRCARALAITGVPVHLRSAMPKHRSPVGEDKLVDVHYADLLNASISTYAAQVQMVVPTPGLLARLVTSRYYTPEQVKYINARRVISTVWERFSGVPKDDLAALSICGQAWVGCPASKELLVEEGIDADKVRVVPCPYLPGDPHLALFGRKRKPGPVRFYHVGKWEPRKEQRRIIGAFLQAFKPGEAMLLLKTSEKSPPFGDDYPASPAVALGQWLADPTVKANGWTETTLKRGFFLIAKRLTSAQMVELHRMGDVYVTLSRGEGFDMPAFDAKLAGNLMVYTPSGGPQAFASAHDCFVMPRATRVPCHPFYQWPKHATYLDYELENVVPALRAAADAVRRIGVADWRHPEGMAAFSAESVGALMRSNLEELAELIEE